MKKPTKPTKKRKSGGNKKKKQYKVRNWKEYNEALVKRGELFFHITEEALGQWYLPKDKRQPGKRGAPLQFSDSAIEACLMVQHLLHLPLRAAEGTIRMMLAKLGVSHKAPDYSTLSIRGKRLAVNIRVRKLMLGESLHLVVDSSGVKVFGEGEWKVRQHGYSKRRTWKKLHIGIDQATGDIEVAEVTGSDTADCEVFKPLLDRMPSKVAIDQVSADGSFDKRVCYQALTDRQVAHIAIPPQKNAKIWQHGNTKAERLPRDENLRRIRAVGRRQWKQESNYHRRSLVENSFFRFKTIFGDSVAARTFLNQRTELLVKCKILNRMTLAGMPLTAVVG